MQLPFLGKLEKFRDTATEQVGFRLGAWPVAIAGLVLLLVAGVLFPSGVAVALNIALFFLPLWLPTALISGAWMLYLICIRSEFIATQPTVLLEIRPPRSLVKTPLAMETLLTSLHILKGESNWFQVYIQGKTRPYWSLELVSIEGKIHFYIWTRTEFRRLTEAAVYAQYPGAQVIEVPDYSRMISATPEEYAVWGCDFRHTQPDPYPIKTYVDFGLDKVQKEPEQVDPFANLMEFLGSIGKGEHFWTQIVIRTAGSEKYAGKLTEEGKPWTWRDKATEEVKKIRKRAQTKSKFFDPTTGKMVETEGFPNPTNGDSEMIAAIERNVSKLAFDVGIRSVYIAQPKKFNPIMITGMIAMWKPFSSESYNGIKATRWGIDYSDYPWEKDNEKKKDDFRRGIVQAYRRRQFFHHPFAFGNHMIMSTEEIATIYHIPSQAAGAPGIERIPSATSEAPSNLPV